MIAKATRLQKRAKADKSIGSKGLRLAYFKDFALAYAGLKAEKIPSGQRISSSTACGRTSLPLWALERADSSSINEVDGLL